MKNKADKNGFVFSTNPNFNFEEEETQLITLAANLQKLRVQLETKHRGGKAATVITGFSGTLDDIEKLGKQIKNACGTGGSVKDGEILIQGDNREKVWQWLLKNGYTNAKKAGG